MQNIPVARKSVKSLNVITNHKRQMHSFKFRVEKEHEPLELMTTWPSLGRNYLNPTSPVVADQTCTSQEKFWIIPLYKTNSGHQIIWSELLYWGHAATSVIFFFCWSFSVVDSLLFEPLAYCPSADVQLADRWSSVFPAKCLDKIGNSFFQSMTAIGPGPWGTKAAPTHDGPPPYFMAGMKFQCCWCVVQIFLSPYRTLCVPSEQIYSHFICPQTILQAVLWNIQVLFCKLVCEIMFILESSGIDHGVLWWTPFSNVLPNVYWQTKTESLARVFSSSDPLVHLTEHSLLCSCSHQATILNLLHL